MSKAETRRLGRGLSSLMNTSDLPVEQEISTPSHKPEANKPGASAPDSSSGSGKSADPLNVPNASVVELPIDSIVPNPHQPRRSMNEQAMGELAASIKATGLIQPILVRRTAEGQTQLIAGERRWRACKMAGLKTILAIVREVDVFTQAQMALIENIQREDLNPIDRAMGYRTLVQELGLTQAELAGRMGEDRAVIAHYVRLLELPQQVQEIAEKMS